MSPLKSNLPSCLFIGTRAENTNKNYKLYDTKLKDLKDFIGKKVFRKQKIKGKLKRVFKEGQRRSSLWRPELMLCSKHIMGLNGFLFQAVLFHYSRMKVMVTFIPLHHPCSVRAEGKQQMHHSTL